MFSFFKRNKSQPKNSNSNNNDNANKTSVNMQLAIERQQASLHQVLEQKRKNDVNDREQKDVSSHTANNIIVDEDRNKNRSTTRPSLCDVLVEASGTCAAQKQQNYDQWRDAKRATYFQYPDSLEQASRQGIAPSSPPPKNSYQPFVFSPTAAVASSLITDQKCLTIAGTSSSNAYTSVYDSETMGRGRNNRNKHRSGGNGANIQQNQSNKNAVKNLVKSGDDTKVSKNVICENSYATTTNVEVEHNEQNLNISANADENSEKSASISCENVPHDENSCSINSQPYNKNDNIAAFDEEASVATSIVSTHDDEKNESLVDKDAASSGVKNDEESEQQVGAPLQRNPSARRVTFAPSPPRSVASSSDDEEEETTSEDIFYEAATDTPSDTQKLRILSTVTSHSSDCQRIDEETSEVDTSTSSGESSSSSFNSTNGNGNDNNHNNNDVVCAKIILSVNENSDKSKLSDNGVENDDKIKTNAFSSDETSSSSISSDAASAPKTIKPYMQDTIALPDIVAEMSLFEQQHLSADEM
jgi:hypothetical protein